MMKTVYLGFILLQVHCANAQYINKIIDEPNEGFHQNHVSMTDQHLVYQTNNDNTYSLWSMDLETQSKDKIYSGPIRQLAESNNLLYFVVRTEELKNHLWQSDGTKAGTLQVSHVELGGDNRFSINDNLIFVQNNSGQLLQLQNNELINREIIVNSRQHICVFGTDDFVVQTESDTSNSYVFKRFNNNVITDVYSYSSANNHQAGFTLFNDSCYFQYIERDSNERKIISIPKSGMPELFNAESSIPVISKLFTHDDRLYAIAGEDFIYNSIYRLSTDLNGYDASITVNNYYDFRNGNSVNHLIASLVGGREFEAVSTQLLLDKDLNIIPIHQVYSQFQNGGSSATQSAVIHGSYSTDLGTVIQLVDTNNEVSAFSIKNLGLQNVISHKNSAQVFLRLFDEQTQRIGIYSLNDTPALNDLVNGTWHNPERENQGLVVQKGRRADGSHYIFTTLYTFDQGQPLWLAGVSNLTVNQQLIDVTLYQYDGLQMFEYDAMPNREVFGQLTLELVNCDQLSAAITSEAYNQTLSLIRIDDTSYKHLCADISPLPEASNNKFGTLMEKDHE